MITSFSPLWYRISLGWEAVKDIITLSS
ncbi:hypothetical protein F383_24517 [Gossypium arboreum]|uniref:Uncharacterized protein n=1 Tax=Gossypium arboreum TaxID=29729 RepID=A0A0B0P393_GOSAR|nr:hypothetical protein F383_24517 [Gossypium arboreum]